MSNYVTEVLAARDLLYAGFDRLKIPYYRSQANFVLFRAGDRAILGILNFLSYRHNHKYAYDCSHCHRHPAAHHDPRAGVVHPH